jgi:hypothetical protein
MKPAKAQSSVPSDDAAVPPAKDKLYTPPVRVKNPVKLTAGQFLKTAGLKESIAAMVRAMYGKKIMAFGEWDATVSKLLTKPVH